MSERPFPELHRTITREMVARYGEVNGDRNLIHYEDAVAREAGFERAVAHGAITAAVIAEACRVHFGPAWAASGRLAVKFIRPVLVGQTLITGGEPLAAAAGAAGAMKVWCADESGEPVLVGEASSGADS